MSWTDERVEVLKKLWMEGLSASQIAAELSDGVTRNAVIGKVHRLKLSARAKPASTGDRSRAASRPQVQGAMPRRAPAGAGTAFAAPPVDAVAQQGHLPKASIIGATALQLSPQFEAEAYAAPATAGAELVIPESDRIGLLGLSERTCKWPIGDPLSASFHFCGRSSLEGKPYCEFHARKAYHQIERKRR